MSRKKSWFEALFSIDRRQIGRREATPLVAYFWNGAESTPHAVRDISAEGMFILTEQRWYPGTVITMTLQRRGMSGSDPGASVRLQAQVVRSDEGGVGLAFILPPPSRTRRVENAVLQEVDRKALGRFLNTIQGQDGTAFLDYSLLVPATLVLVIYLTKSPGFWFGSTIAAITMRAVAGSVIVKGVMTSLLKAAATVSTGKGLLFPGGAALPARTNHRRLSLSLRERLDQPEAAGSEAAS
jgi:PilZ domain